MVSRPNNGRRESIMAFVVIFAGGTGIRMSSSDIPKQFMELDNKPIIIRTLENFSKHPKVDHIVIACIAGWEDELRRSIKKFKVKKVLDIVPGGETGHRSIKNGLLRVKRVASPSDIVLICDGVRPNISQSLITKAVTCTERYGSAVPVLQSIDSVLISDDGKTCGRNMSRSSVYITQAPQGYTMELIMWAHDEAEARGIPDAISSADLLIGLGKTVHLFKGERDNIKITTQEDVLALRANYYYSHYKKFAEEEKQHGV
jgi:2-C-methyl-D-erythritol 4-phosphate cytidylyltransferase